MKNVLLILFLPLFLIMSCRQVAEPVASYEENKQHLPPDDRYGPLFVAVQMAAVFPDGKTFVDCTPKYPTDEVLARYAAASEEEGFDLEAFVKEHFDLPKKYASGFQADLNRNTEQHIQSLWKVLTREPEDVSTGTLIPLPYPYIVPGGRFGEIYYWDSYFTMLGLQVSGKKEMIKNMVNNFAYLIDSVGYIPNGNRTYFLSRSQPPFFAAMVELLAEEYGAQTLVQYIPQLEKEYRFWMAGAERLSEAKPSHRRVVRMSDGAILNRYWDDKNVPRAEMYRDDVETAKESDRLPKDLYRDIRAACESGWDFSSRWFRDPATLHTIHTTEIIPVDLNALLFNLEQVLARAYQQKGEADRAADYQDRANRRRKAVLQYCWDADTGYFQDYDFVKKAYTGTLSLAGMYPLFFKMAQAEHAKAAAEVIRSKFLHPGGVVSTLHHNGQQWDAPNGWAPLQWITIAGLRNYQQRELAAEISRRWTQLNEKVYRNTGKMVEKYNVMDMALEAGGGEYPVQDGFGWTNGVYLKLISE